MPASREEQEVALRTICPLAVKAERLYGVPAELTCAQIILESDWLKKPIHHNNVMGMKRAPRHKLYVVRETREVVSDKALPEYGSKVKRKERRPDGLWNVWMDLEFAAFPSLEAAVLDYASLLSNSDRYSKAWAAFKADQENWQALARGVASAGYSTDPGYAKILLAIGTQPNVAAAIAAARVPGAVVT